MVERRPTKRPTYNAIKAQDAFFAGARGALDSLPFGVANGAPALTRAAIDWSQGADPRRALEIRLQQERARDADDTRRHPQARAVGHAVGAQLTRLVPHFRC